jgi:hypothetical protein
MSSSPSNPKESAVSRSVLCLALLAASAVTHAGEPVADPFAFPERGAEAADFVAVGLRQEAVLSADFDADGNTDQAMVVRNDDRRVLLVLLGEKAGGFRRIGVAELSTGALGEAALSAPKGVLVIKDLTGGTSAVDSTYRYRYEKATGRMRLIGDDVSLYSRTWQHGMTTVSTNRLTGKRITTINDLVGEGENAELGPDQVTTTTVATEPKLYLETSPSPDDTLGWGDSPEAQ